jgi:hypothetical protein
MTTAEFKEKVNQIFDAGHGRTIGRDDIRDLLISAKKLQLAEKGLVNHTVEVSEVTVDNYYALVKDDDNVAVTHAAREKTESRFTAENSFLSAICQVFVCATTHCLCPCPPGMKPVDLASNLLCRLVSEANNGAPVGVISLKNLTSTDDTTSFVHEGIDSAGQYVQERLRRKSDKTEVLSSYSKPGVNHAPMLGIRVRIQMLMFGDGMMGPIVLWLTNVTEEEMSLLTVPSGIVIARLRGLCVGGATDLRATQVGHLILMRRTNSDKEQASAEAKAVEYVRTQVVDPAVDLSREHQGMDSDWDSTFYTTFPKKRADIVGVGSEGEGQWDMLEQFVGLGFVYGDPDTVTALTSRDATTGLFVWSDDAMTHLENVWDGELVASKQLHMVAYLFELVYDLMLAPEENVSSSPGFERPLAIFPKPVRADAQVTVEL